MDKGPQDGVYAKLVEWVRKHDEPRLNALTQSFINRAIQLHAKDYPSVTDPSVCDPFLQNLIRNEVERRAYGVGPMQDNAEAKTWAVLKMFVGLGVSVGTNFIKHLRDPNNKNKSFGLIANVISLASAGIAVNNLIELWRCSRRFAAGLQGCEVMALRRYNYILEEGVDPLTGKEYAVTKTQDPQSGKFFYTVEEAERHAVKQETPQDTSGSSPKSPFACDALKSAPIHQTTLQEQASKGTLQEVSL